MIKENCSCGSKFESDNAEATKLWREWRRKHTCPYRETEPEFNSQANTQIETLPIGFAPQMHHGRRDTGLEE